MSECIGYLCVAFAAVTGVGEKSACHAGGLCAHGALEVVSMRNRRFGNERHIEEVYRVTLSDLVRARAERELEYLIRGDLIGHSVHLYLLAGCIGGAAEYEHERAA